MRYRVRCSKCRTRAVLYSHPSVSIAKCEECGSREFRIDTYRQQGKEGKKQTCHCGGWHFPHRKNCKGCVTGEPHSEEETRSLLRSMQKSERGIYGA